MPDQPADVETGTIGDRPPAQQQRSSIPSFLFISFMLFMLTNHNGDEFLARHQYQDALQLIEYQLSNYTAWMNGTASNFSLVCDFMAQCYEVFTAMISRSFSHKRSHT